MKRKEILFTIFTWVVILYSLNFICGLIVKNRYIALEPNDQRSAAASYGYFKPNQDRILLFSGHPDYHVKINAMGLRTTGLDDRLKYSDIENRYKILCVGDSFTFGLFLNNENTYPYMLQQALLKDHKEAVVLNAGIGSTTILDHLHYLKVKGLSLKPNLVILNFYDNDLIELGEWRNPLYGRMIDENKFSLAKTIKLAKFMRIFRRMELAVRYRRSTNKIKDERVREVLFSQSRDLEDVLYVTAVDRGLILTDPYHDELKPAWDRYFKALDEMAALLKANHVDFLYIIYPSIYTVFDRGQNNYQGILKSYLEARAIEYIDLQPRLKAQKDEYKKLYNNLPRDFHLSLYGNTFLIDEIYKKIKNRIP